MAGLARKNPGPTDANGELARLNGFSFAGRGRRSSYSRRQLLTNAAIAVSRASWFDGGCFLLAKHLLFPTGTEAAYPSDDLQGAVAQPVGIPLAILCKFDD